MDPNVEPNTATLSPEAVQVLIQFARRRFRLWRLWTGCSFAAFFLSALLVIPFLEGHPWHAQWEPLGRYLVLAAIGLWSVFVICAAMVWNAWCYLRRINR
jgi:hypothetical protein